MEAYKLDISVYAPVIPGEPDPPPYKPREILPSVLLSPRLDLDPAAALKNHVLALRIIDEPSDTILLAADEYHTIRNATDKLTGWSLPDIEMLKRITGAEKVEVAEVHE